jgi:cellulose synthase/poly-beta-1,6-N-acetylglucosamine synthase-like glycosyltransferase
VIVHFLSLITLAVYLGILAVLSLYGFHRYWILYLYWKHYKRKPPSVMPSDPVEWPTVTVQLPVYNEYYVVERLIDAVCRLDYPKDRLEIQVLDDSTDDSRVRASAKVEEKRAAGFSIHHIVREKREGFKAGALAHGLKTAQGEFIAIFDADFLPDSDFLKKTVVHFQNQNLGMVQTRWGHLNPHFSLLTRMQSLFLDGHFVLEHTARNRSGAFFNFNGTAGVWRRQAIEEAGGWADDTLTEDLDISYRAQLKGWKFLFLPQVVCLAELPVDATAFRSQQHRWTKGAFQVAKKILPALWRSPLPLRVKLESTMHLTSNVGYLLMFIFSLLLFPSLLARAHLAWPVWANALELAAFLSTMVSLAVFYTVVQWETGTPLRFLDLPALLAMGVGLCLNNSRAVWQAIRNVPTEFHRTPKLNILHPGQEWLHKRYRKNPGGWGLGEIFIGGYLTLAYAWSLSNGSWFALPFLGVFLCGYLYMGALTLAHVLQKS